MSLYDYMVKSAKKAEPHGTGLPAMQPWFKPYEHQEAAVKKLFENKGKMILAHEMGTGKTVTSIYGFEKMRHQKKAIKALIVVPSGLRDNFANNGVGKFTTSSFQIVGSSAEKKKKGKRYVRPEEVKQNVVYTIVSYAMFRRDPAGYMKRSGADTLIFDEFHKTRNESAKTFKAALVAREYATNFMGLTASLINNSPAEIATLLTISERNRDMSPQQFKRKFVQTVGFTKGFGGGKKAVKGLKNIPELVEKVDPKIHFVSTGQLKGKTMPKKETKNVPVEMSDEQYRLYQLALNKLGPVKEYITRRDPNVNVKDAEFIFAQIAQARQLSNAVHTGRKDVSTTQSAKRTPKIKKILDDTQKHLATKGDNKVVLYSNLIKGGVDVLSAGLHARGIDYAVFVGKGTEVRGSKVTAVSRQEGVTDYQAGKKRVIILSGAGAEGLDLKNSTAFFSLDGHFNPQRILQAEGRARRLGGQAHRPPEQRKVDVRRYISTVPEKSRPGVIGKMFGRKTPQTTDEWMYSVAGRKFQTTEKFYESFKEPHKYVMKYRDSKGKIRYKYPPEPKKPKGLFARMFGGSDAKPPKLPAQPPSL